MPPGSNSRLGSARLGNGVGKSGQAEIILVDRYPTHFWKRLLHEVASGQIDAASHQIDYAAHARCNNFRFLQGTLESVNREVREIVVNETTDSDGRTLLPRRTVAFDTLVLAIGSATNFFSVPGASEHALTLETVEQAEAFRRRLLANLLRIGHAQQTSPEVRSAPVRVTIIGGGATGVELASALRGSAEMLRDYPLPTLNPSSDIHVRLVESGERVLPSLPERISFRAQGVLSALGVELCLATRVKEVLAEAVLTGDDESLSSDIGFVRMGGL